MEKFKWTWWVIIAGVMAVVQVFLGFGNLIDDDGGPLYGQLVLLGFTVLGATLIAAGIINRSRNRRRAGTLIGVGVLPSAAGIAFFWFPPVFVYGILAIVVAAFAFRDASESREPLPA